MKRTITHILAAAAVILLSASCWREEIKDLELGSDLQLRHVVTNLQAVAGDGEVTLSWGIPEGWNPSKFIIAYTNPDQTSVRVETTQTSQLVGDLQNGYKYSFSVQALYGEGILSGVKSVEATPLTSRIPVGRLNAVPMDGGVILSWTKPSAAVQSYKLSYYMEDTPGDVKNVTIAGDKESYTLEGLENDKNYYFTIVGVYAKGDSDPASVKSMPRSAQAFFLSREKASINQPIRFQFNTEAYPTATSVFWEFPGGERENGADVEYAFGSTGEKQVILHATIGGTEKTWKMNVEIREWVVMDNDFPASAAYNGFKGTCPVFSPDGKTVYIITFNGITNLLSYDLESGEKKWTYSVSHGSYNMLTVNPVTGDIYFGTTTAGDFFAVTPDGNLKWQFTGLGSMKSGAPAVSKDGQTVFAGDASGKIVAIDAGSGAEKWNATVGAACAGILVNGDEILVGAYSASNTLSFLKASDGSIIKQINGKASMTDISGFGISADHKTAYFGNTGGGVSSVNLETHEMVVDGLVIGGNNMYEPVVAPNGDVFYGCKDSKCYLVDGVAMTLKATFDPGIGANNGFNYAHPAVDTDGNFYVSSGQIQNMNYILDPSLNMKDSWQYDGAGNKQMGGNNYLDGVLYSAFIGANGANGLFVGKYVGGTRYNAHGFDICGSFCIK